jgi:predicted Zn-dependent peptidase
MVQEYWEKVRGFAAVICLAFGTSYAAAQAPSPAPDTAAGIAREIGDFTLANGMHFVILERHQTPLVSFHIYVGAGLANIPAGQSGLGRLIEKLAWSGTETTGSRDWTAEKKALDAVEDAADRLDTERAKGPRADSVKVTGLTFDLQAAIDRAQALAKPDAYRQALTDQGATGLSASVSADAIHYACTLPSNRAELWFSMESQRLSRPVFRGFYAQRDDLVAQLRGLPGQSADSRLLELFGATAFLAHPYRNPADGWPGDLERLRPADLRRFYDRYLVAANLTVGIAGDLTAAEARQLAERYFTGPSWTAKPAPPPIPTREPVQNAPRLGIAYSATTPLVAIGYKRPDEQDRDDIAFDTIQMLLGGPTGLLAAEAIQTGWATSTQAVAAFPGERYPALFLIRATPSPSTTLERAVATVEAVIDRLRNQPVDEAGLERAKSHLRSLALSALGENPSAASLLAASSAEYGDWHQVFVDLDRLARLSAADIQRVALKYLAPERRTVAYTGSVVVPPGVVQ